MSDYSKGKIYAIRSHSIDKVYVGSTTQPLSKRMAEHRSCLKLNRNRMSGEILQYPDAYIELIENFPCENKEQLNKREGEIIRSMDCVNKRIAGRTMPEYRKDTKDRILEKQREWRSLKKASSLSPTLTIESV